MTVNNGDIIRVTALDENVHEDVSDEFEVKRRDIVGEEVVVIKTKRVVDKDSIYSGLILHVARVPTVESVSNSSELSRLQSEHSVPEQTIPIVYTTDTFEMVAEYGGVDTDGPFL